MRSISPMRCAKTGYIVISLALCVLGTAVLLFPDLSIALLGTLLGIVLIVFGCVKLVGYFSKDLFRLAFQYDLAFGVLLIALGVIVLVRRRDAVSFLCAALGIFVLADGLFKVQITVDAKPFGIRQWWLILAVALVTAAAGIVLVVRPGESARTLMILMGVSLLAEGLLNLIVALSTVKILRRPDVIDVPYEDVQLHTEHSGKD